MKKIVLIVIVTSMVLAVAGCTQPGNQATPTPRPSDTTPSPLPTQTPPPTQTPTSWLSGYTEYKVGQQQPLVNGVTARFEKAYHTGDWAMPAPLQGAGKPSGHGAVYDLQLTNPTSSNQSVTAGTDLRSIITYRDTTTGLRKFLPSSDVFYDPATQTQYGQVRLAPGESKRVYMLAYINDTQYDQYGGMLDPQPGLDVNPV